MILSRTGRRTRNNRVVRSHFNSVERARPPHGYGRFLNLFSPIGNSESDYPQLSVGRYTIAPFNMFSLATSFGGNKKYSKSSDSCSIPIRHLRQYKIKSHFDLAFALLIRARHLTQSKVSPRIAATITRFSTFFYSIYTVYIIYNT